MVRLILCSPIPVKRRRASATMLGLSHARLRRFWIDRWRAKATIEYNWESYHEGKRSSTEASRCRRLLERLSARGLDHFHQCSRFHRPERHALPGKRGLSDRTIAAHNGRLGETAALLRGRTEEGSARRRCSKSLDVARAPGRLYRSRERSDRGSADGPALQAGDLPLRRAPDGRDGPQGRGLRSRSER